MKRCLIMWGALLTVATAWAGSYRVITLSVQDVATNATATTATETAVTGKPLAFSWFGDTNITVAVTTVADYGLSPAARTIVAATNAETFYRVLPESEVIYLRLDRVVLSATYAPVVTNHYGLNAGKGLLLIEMP